MNTPDPYEDLDFLTKWITVGTADQKRRVRLLDLALERMAAWAATAPLPREGQRGGTHAVTEANERAENRRVARSALEDHGDALELRTELRNTARKLRTFIPRYTITIDASKLPDDDIPGCISCAREKLAGNRIVYSAHFEPISERPRYAKARLCRWCGDHALAHLKEKRDVSMMDEHDIVAELTKPSVWPPHQAVDIRHRQSEQAAGRWLAEQQRITERRKKAS